MNSTGGRDGSAMMAGQECQRPTGGGVQYGTACLNGSRQNNACIGQKAPTCAQGALQGTQCVTRTTDTTPPTNTLNHHNVECPTGYQYGSGLNGGHPPYAASAGKFWTSATATKPDVPPHSCWQLRSGSCPTGQTMAHAIYSGTPNRVLIGYADLSPEPDGKRWNRESANADYACYKLVEKQRNFFDKLPQAIADYFNEEAERQGETALINARALSEFGKTAGRTIYVTACADEAEFIAEIVSLSGGAINVYQAKKLEEVRKLRNKLNKSGYAAIGFGIIAVGCKITDSSGNDQARSSKDKASDSASVPAPASNLLLSAGDGEIAVAWTAPTGTSAARLGYRVQWKLASQTWDHATRQYKDFANGSALAVWWTGATGLANGSAYDVRVAAFNADRFSDWITAAATPVAPAYKAPADLVSDVRGYAAETHHGQDHVDRWNGALEGLCVEDFPGVSAMTSAQAQGHADAYSSQRWDPVVAELKKAEAANCTITAKPKPAAPDPASGLSLSAGDKQIAVSWTASATTPAEGFGYRVQWKLTTQTWDQALALYKDLQYGVGLATSHTITGLANGSAYDVRVAAYNTTGFAAWVTGQATPTAPASAPDPASGLSLSAGDKQIAVSWSASATTPAAGFGYRVQWKLVTQTWGDAAAGSEDLDHGSDLATSHTITGLANGSAYDVRVAAFNANGVSDWITGQTTPTAPKPEPKPSLAFDSVSCASSGSGWVITATWSKTPETLKPDIWANEAKNYGHRGFQKAVAGTSTTFDVPNAGWYQVGMQAKIAGNKKVGDNKAVRCR